MRVVKRYLLDEQPFSNADAYSPAVVSLMIRRYARPQQRSPISRTAAVKRASTATARHTRAGQLPPTSRTLHISLDARSSTTAHEPDSDETILTGSTGTSNPYSILDFVVPRRRFGSSIFSTPLLLFLRLFYQATSVEHAVREPQDAVINSSYNFRTLSGHTDTTHTRDPHSSAASPPIESSVLDDISSKTTPTSWTACLLDSRYPIDPSFSVTSLTWIKSLSAPASHEFIQFVLASPDSKRSFRCIAERDTHGDWVFIAHESSRSSASSKDDPLSGANLTRVRQLDEQHDLPLPLLSLSWSHLPPSQRPTALEFAHVLEHVTQRCPRYNILREHCWWYAEAVFEVMLKRAHDRAGTDPGENGPGKVVLKQWPAAPYRYSYIVVGKKVLRREDLVREAGKFQGEMDRGGVLRW